MAAFLTCCTAASPTPFFIFRPKRYGWKLVYASTRLLVSTEKRKGKKILLRHPVYKRTDPLCCPSSYTRYVVSYSRGQFTRKKL
jgi:hypothetical protein